MAIITLSEVKDFSDISGTDDDTDLAIVIDAVDAYISRVTGSLWGTTATITDELHDYAPVLFLHKMIVNSITAVKIGYGNDFTTLDSNDYRWNEVGRIMLSHDKPGSYSTYDFDEVKVTYEYGSATVPGDLKMAALMLADVAHKSGLGAGQSITREKIGSREIEYGSSTDSVFDIFTIIDGYKV